MAIAPNSSCCWSEPHLQSVFSFAKRLVGKEVENDDDVDFLDKNVKQLEVRLKVAFGQRE